MALPPFPATSPIVRAAPLWGTFPHSAPAMGTLRLLTGCGGAPDTSHRAVGETTVRPPGTDVARRTGKLTAGAVSGAVS